MHNAPIPSRFGRITGLTAAYRERIKSHDLLVEPVFRACKLTYAGAGKPGLRLLDAMSVGKSLALRYGWSSGKPGLRLLDAMSGPGGLGLELLAMFDRQRPPGNRSELAVMFNDVRKEPIDQIHAAFPDSFGSILCDVHGLKMAEPGQKFDVAVVRYGLTGLTSSGLQIALRAIHNCILPGGRIVVADLAPAGEDVRKDVAMILDAARYWFAGKGLRQDTSCRIPTAAEWPGLLISSGYTDVEVAFRGGMELDAGQWAGKLGLDMGREGALKAMNDLILCASRASEPFAMEFHVHGNHKKVTLEVPVIVVAANTA